MFWRFGFFVAVLLTLGGCVHQPYAALCDDPPSDQQLARDVRLACAGSRFAATKVARAYETGEGLPQNAAMARLTYEYAATGGPGRTLVTGGTPIDCPLQPQRTNFASGATFDDRRPPGRVCRSPVNRQFLRGSTSDPEAMYRLGQMYWDGVGVVPDKSIAIQWLKKAARRGHEGAAETLRAISNSGLEATDAESRVP